MGVTAGAAASYDYRTRRQTKAGGTDVTFFRYDQGDAFQEFKASAMQVEFVRGGGMGGGIGSILYSDRTMVAGGAEETFTYNGSVGHVVALTSGIGMTTETNRFDAFGNVIGTTGFSLNNRLANTKERDVSIPGVFTLDNHGFRYYNPMTGRYISRDPIGYGDGMNVYLYVKGNPINRIDPLGLWEWLKDVILPALDVVVPVADFAYGLIDSVSMGLASETTTRTYGKETTDKITGSGGYKVAEVASYVDPRVATKKLGTALIKAGVDYVTDQVIEETLGEVDGLNEARMMAGARGGKPQLPGRAGGIGPVLKGQEGARKSKQEAEANGETVKGEGVTFELPSGKRTRSDLVTQTPDDQLKVREAKQGESAKLSPGQKEMKDTVNDGGTVIPRGQRAKDAGFVPGTPVRINNFEEDRF